jgi:hypothetical protein
MHAPMKLARSNAPAAVTNSLDERISANANSPHAPIRLTALTLIPKWQKG